MGNAQGQEEKQHGRKPSDYSIGDSTRSQHRSIHEKLVREHDKKSNLHDFYEIIDEIGQGGLCKIYKIRKKHDMIGGSSREGNIKHKKGGLFGKHHHASRRSLSRFSNIPPVYSEPSIRTMMTAGTPPTSSPKPTNPKDRVKAVAMAHATSEPSLNACHPHSKNGRKQIKKATSGAIITGTTSSPPQETEDSQQLMDDDDSNQSSKSNDSVPIPMGVPLGHYSTVGSRSPRMESMDTNSSDDLGGATTRGSGHFGSPTATSRTSLSGAGAAAASSANFYFALKEINLAMVKEDKIDQLKNEVEILKALDHKNIIKAYETFHSKQTKKLMIVMELCTGGDLVRWTVACGALFVSWQVFCRIHGLAHVVVIVCFVAHARTHTRKSALSAPLQGGTRGTHCATNSFRRLVHSREKHNTSRFETGKWFVRSLLWKSERGCACCCVLLFNT